MIKRIFSIFIISIFFFQCESPQEKTKLFESLDPDETGIDFQNTLITDRRLNIIDFNGFYNGGGVATGDINNDGLIDIFFTSNREKNRLYINKGNLKFEDITEKANVGGNSEWNTGVTMADVNGDGFLDIYINAVTDFKGLKGHNELYINNGDLTFTESSEKWMMNFGTYGCQSVFFDYDHDGDLDCYIVNMAHENSLILVKSVNRNNFHPRSGDVLLRNEGTYFKAVTEDAGIYRSEIGFGLAVTVGDFNNDNWEDIYVSNDFYENDYLYINKKDGTFEELGYEYFGHMSRFSMGADAADIDNDGDLDLMTLDMAPEDEIVEKESLGEEPYDTYEFKQTYGYKEQYGRNSLQLNNSGKSFSDIACYSGVEATDWSWAPLIADFDNDKIKDIFISNGIVKRANNLDLTNYAEDYLKKQKPGEKVNLAKYYKDYYDQMPIGDWHDYMYKGKGNLSFDDKSIDWGFENKTVSNGASYADLDNDGDLELIINRINRPALVYKNLTREKLKTNYISIKLEGRLKNKNGIGAKVYVKTKDTIQMQQLVLTRGFLSSVSSKLHFGLGNSKEIDSLWVKWNDGLVTLVEKPLVNTSILVSRENLKVDTNSEQEKVAVFDNENYGITYTHKENIYSDFSEQGLIPFKVSTEGPALVVGDLNNDGLEDVFLGGAKEQKAQIWIQSTAGYFAKTAIPEIQKDSLFEDIDATFFDANNDGNIDIYVASGGNENQLDLLVDRLYINDGKASFYKSTTLPEIQINSGCVTQCDINNDGAIDLFVGGRTVPGSYGLPASSYVLLNNHNGGFIKDVSILELNNYGMVTAAQWQDFDMDGLKDLMIAGEFMSLTIFYNRSEKFDKQVILNQDLKTLSGLWHSLKALDFDEDGDIDVFAGNLGLNNRFGKKDGNGTIKMFVKDFDNNGSVEQILCYNRNRKWIPVAGRDDLGKLMPIIKKRFNKYADYAGKSYEEIFTQEERNGAVELTVNIMESLYLSNDGKGGFSIEKLPIEAQLSPIYDFIAGDFYDDGRQDILGAGNFFGVSTYQGRYDAGKGFLFNLDDKNNIVSKSLNKEFDGEVRKLRSIKIGNKNCVIVVRNNEKLEILEQDLK